MLKSSLLFKFKMHTEYLELLHSISVLNIYLEDSAAFRRSSWLVSLQGLPRRRRLSQIVNNSEQLHSKVK